MKYKRIAALAAALLMTVSVAGSTALAADWNKSTMVGLEQTRSDDGTKIIRREAVKFDYSYYTAKEASSDSKVTKTYVYQVASDTKGSEEVTTDENGKKAVVVTIPFTPAETAKLAASGVTVRLADLKLPVLKDGDAITAGWSTVKTEKIYETQTKAEAAKGFLLPESEITDLLTKAKGCTLYPVFRNKTAEELAADALIEQKAEKVAKDKNGTEISAAKVNVNVKALSEEKVSNALKVSGADSATSALYDITVTDKNGDNVTVLKGKTVTVTLERPTLDGNVNFKLYHIDGSKAEEMEITVSDDAITFESDEFSPYVLTWHVSSGASDRNNPSTGDDFNVVPFIIIALLALAAGVTVIVIRKGKSGGDDDEEE